MTRDMDEQEPFIHVPGFYTDGFGHAIALIGNVRGGEGVETAEEGPVCRFLRDGALIGAAVLDAPARAEALHREMMAAARA